ncbi:MAG TPA: glycosyltransferase family 2 protein [Bacteroidia bacterium]|nr:glycosyltransferase family 2 protein [Bacteroidia bacterium]
MRIIAYFINFNDSFYIPFFAKHYGKFCEKIIMYDNYSTDNSVELAESLRIEVRTFGRRGVLDDQHYLDVKNHCWKEQRDKGIDYVIVVDADEFVHFDTLSGTCPKVIGYNMISDNLPVNDIYEISTGSYSESYSKQAIFCPNALIEINYVHGCHRNNKIGDCFDNESKVKLLHYRQIGGIQRMLDRHAEYRKRMSTFNLQHGMGIHYLHTDEQKIAEWNQLKLQAKQLW